MGARRKIAVLLHARDRYPVAQKHFIWSLCDLWRAEGIDIAVQKGPRRPVTADLLIPHVDLTVLPDEYVKVFGRYPRVINRGVLDISKRLISRNLLGAGDSHEGPVIVKTNLNFGGIPESRLIGRPWALHGRKSWWPRFWRGARRRSAGRDWANLRRLEPSDYQIFPDLDAVPGAVFSNDALVVERFLPEMEDGCYYLRVYLFFGSRGYCVRIGSREPIVKAQAIVSREETAIPDEIVSWRRALGLDYGKLDFVIRGKRVVLLDVNRTPGLLASGEQMRANALRLAPGLEALF